MGGQIIRGLPIDEYHAHPAWSSSKIKLIETHGPLYAIRKVRGELKPTEQTDALRKGSLFDALVTGEGAERFQVAPEKLDRRTKAGKEWADEVESQGRTIITPAEAAWAHDAFEALMAIDEARESIEEAEFQVSIRARLATHPLFELQGRPDLTCLDGLKTTDFLPTFDDLKSARSLDAFARGNHVVDYGYHVQAAIVREVAREAGIDDTRHRWFVVTKPDQPPVQAVVFNITEAWMAHGMRDLYRALDRIYRWTESGVWPRTEKTVLDAVPPAWLDRRAEAEEREEAFGEAA